ncbi:MAG: GNAT family N-acetyltransferase, partial [Pseudobdellovibrio sp.]
MYAVPFSQISLRQLHPKDEAVFVSSLQLWQGEAFEWYSFILPKNPDIDFSDMLQQLENEREGVDLPEGRVPATMLYAFYNNQIIGRFNIRHTLNDFLLKRGGHVGYAVAPSFRKRGVANQMMKLGLEYIREHLKIDKILITCVDDNVGSIRVIEKSGGIL